MEKIPKQSVAVPQPPLPTSQFRIFSATSAARDAPQVAQPMMEPFLVGK